MSSLPSYVAAAKPVPAANRAAWYKNVAPTYAGIMLWFVFWQDAVKGGGEPGGVLSQGVGLALGGLVLAALVCHVLFYLIPGVLGNEGSAAEDSFTTGLLEHPHYTRPAMFMGMAVPDELAHGHHEQVRTWRRRESLRRTLRRRPDLLARVELTEKDRKLLAELDLP